MKHTPIRPVIQNDYLIISDLDREILRQDSVKLCLDVLQDPAISDVDKQLI